MEPQEHASDKTAGTPLASELTLVALIYAVLLFSGSIIMDGGIIFRLALFAIIPHTAGSALVLLRRRTSPTRFDYMFVKWGIWPLLLVTYAINQTIQHFWG